MTSAQKRERGPNIKFVEKNDLMDVIYGIPLHQWN